MTSSNFARAHKFTAKWEGGLSNHPADRGGITAYGASIEFVKDIASTSSGQNFLQAIKVQLPVTANTIRNLTPEQVKMMFKRQFWDFLRLDRLPYRQALLLYDAAVNHGPKQAVRLAQRGFNKCVSYGSRIAEDGIMGSQTLAALRQDTDLILKSIIQARRDFYTSLVVQKPSQKVFLAGWMNRANDLERYALGDE